MNNGKLLRKTSRDNRDVFAVFKKGGPMEGATFGEKFSWWTKNVFFPHLAFKTCMVILALFLLTMLVIEIVSEDYNDLDYIVGGKIFATSEQMHELSDYMKDVLEKDGEKPSVGHQMLCTENMESAINELSYPDEYAVANRQKIEITFADDEILLFFLDKTYIEAYAYDGAFLELSEFGIESDNKYFVRVDNTPIFQKIGMNHKDGIYAAIKMKNKERSEDSRILEKYERAGRVLSAIVAGEDISGE